MAEFLRNNDISASLDNIINSTRGGSLLLISPYLKFSRRIKEALMDQVQAYRSHVDVVYGKHDLRPEEYKWLADNEIKTYYREPLHAKCYINESHALITSMNLYEFSQQNNDEMGILVSAKDDHDLYEKIKENAYLIRRQSEQVKLEVTRVDDDDDDLPADQPDAPVRVRSESQTTLPETGFCLRCGTEIPCDPERPYCDSHYRSWARFKNESYEENHCHTCGADHATSMAKPLCLSCFRKYRSVLSVAG